MFHGDDGPELALHLVRRPGVAPSEQVQPTPHGAGVRAVVSAAAGDVGGIVVDSAPDGRPTRSVRAALVFGPRTGGLGRMVRSWAIYLAVSRFLPFGGRRWR